HRALPLLSGGRQALIGYPYLLADGIARRRFLVVRAQRPIVHAHAHPILDRLSRLFFDLVPGIGPGAGAYYRRSGAAAAVADLMAEQTAHHGAPGGTEPAALAFHLDGADRLDHSAVPAIRGNSRTARCARVAGQRLRSRNIRSGSAPRVRCAAASR